MKTIKLSSQEQEIENALLEDKYVDVSKKELQEISQALSRRKKNAVLNIRINSQDLEQLKQKAKKLGIRYQTFVSEVLHKVALH